MSNHSLNSSKQSKLSDETGWNDSELKILYLCEFEMDHYVN